MAEGFTCEVETPFPPPWVGDEEEIEGQDYRNACRALPFYGEHEGKRYCVLHFPGEEKRDGFEQVKKSKLAQKDYNFCGAIFPEGTSDFFSWYEFDADVDFTGAVFVGSANFSFAQFSGKETHFEGAQFSGKRTDFLAAQFSGAGTDFSAAQFSSERTDFSAAQFGAEETSFLNTTFLKSVFFTSANFEHRVTFWGSENAVFDENARARFVHVRIDNPALLTFYKVFLRPNWFINVDVRKVDFTEVQWYGLPGGPSGTLDEEIGALKKDQIKTPY